MKLKKKLISIIAVCLCVAISMIGAVLFFTKGTMADDDKTKSALQIIVGASTEDTGASSADIQEKGGSIYVGYGSDYLMTGGTISAHYNKYGGAVYVANGGHFTMTGGIITDCEAEFGGAIYVETGGTCTIKGGEVMGNRSCSAAIFLEEGAILEITDTSIIHDNEVVEKYYINFYVNGLIVESRKVITNVFNLATEELPLSFEECSGYFIDKTCKTALSENIINFTDSELLIDDTVNLYTKAATVDEFDYTLNSKTNTYTISVSDSGLVSDLVMPYYYNGLPVTTVGARIAMEDVVNSITLSAGITTIGNNAFINATGLTDVYLVDSVTSIGESAFEGCSSLKSIEIPFGVTSIGRAAFRNCSSLEGTFVIPSNITVINSNTFYGCSSLTQIILPNTVTELGTYAFYECSGLTSFDFPSKLTEIGTYAFTRCSALTSISIPAGVTQLKASTFSRCTKLTNVTLPETITSFANYVFSNCNNLVNINIPSSVTSMGSGVFSSCGALPTIFIPDGVTTLGANQFTNCDSMTTIYCQAESKPDGWSDDWVGDCTAEIIWGLNASAKIYIYVDGTLSSTLKVSDGTYTIREEDMPLDFESCCGYFLDEYLSRTIANGVIYLSDDNVNIYTKTANPASDFEFFLDSSTNTYTIYALSSVSGDVVLPNEYNNLPVKVIGSSAFEDCDVSSVVISSSVERLAVDSFAFCSLTEIIIPDCVITIEEAFVANENLKNLFISSSVNTVYDGAFYELGETSTIYFEASSQPSGFSDNWDDECGAAIVWGVSIEEYYDSFNYGLFDSATDKQIYSWEALVNTGKVNVSNGALSGNDSTLAGKLVINDSVTSIGNNAFYNCSGLTSIEIPDSVTSIGNSAFYYCKGLISIGLPKGLTSIGDSVFYGCSGLTSIDLPDSLNSIGYNAFNACSGLTSIELPDGITSMGNSAFMYCSGLSSIELPNSLTSIESYTFRYCTGLTSVTMGSSLNSIGNYAFESCSKLTSIELPDSLKSIANSAFCYCTGLTSIYIPSSVTTISASYYSSSPFYGCSSSLVIYCEVERSSSGWSSNWNYYDSGKTLIVRYGYTREDYENTLGALNFLPEVNEEVNEQVLVETIQNNLKLALKREN